MGNRNAREEGFQKQFFGVACPDFVALEWRREVDLTSTDHGYYSKIFMSNADVGGENDRRRTHQLCHKQSMQDRRFSDQAWL